MGKVTFCVVLSIELFVLVVLKSTIGLDKRHADSALDPWTTAGSKSKLSPYQSPITLSIITILLPLTSRRLIERSTLTGVVVFGAVWVAVVVAS